jgi:hypothetical protein
MKDERERHTHPSFGQISFSRISGHQRFYGSELEQDHYIEMTIHHSEIDRELTKDWYHKQGAPVVRLRMTSGQFSELITSMNMGDGVCCTLEMIEGKSIQKLPEEENRKEFVHRKFRDRMKEFADIIRKKQNEAKTLVKKKTLSKEDVRNLEFHLDWLTTEVERNIPFFMECFQETMDEVVSEAKTEIENAILHKVNILGLEKLQEQNKLLG